MPGETSLVFNLLAKDKISGVLDDVQKKFGGFGKAIGGLMAAGGLAAGAALVGGFKQAADNDEANRLLSAKLGLTPMQATEMGKTAGSLYSHNFGDSMGQINEAIGSVVQNIDGMGNSPALQEVTGKVLNLSKTFGQDLGGTTAAISQMLRTGLASSADEALDILTVGFQRGDDKAGDLLDTMTEYGTQFRKLGLDGQTALGLIDQGIKAGARDGDTVADALKEFSIRAIDGSATTIAGYKAIGLNADQMAEKIAAGGPTAAAGLSQVLNGLKAIDDPAKREAAAVELFGTKAEDLGQALFALDPSTAVSALGKVGGAADDMGKTLSGGPKANLSAFMRMIQGGLVDFLGAKVIPAVSRLSSEFLHRFGPALQQAGVWVTTTLVPALVSLWDWIQVKIWPAIQNVAGIIGGALLGAFQTISQAVSEHSGQLSTLWGWIQNIYQFIATYLWPILATTLAIAFRIVAAEIRGVIEIISGLVSAGQWMGGAISDAAGAVMTAVGWVKDAFTNARDWVGDRVNDIVGFFTGLPGRITSAISGLFDGLKESFRSVMRWIQDKWNSFDVHIPGVDTHIPGVGKIGDFDFGFPDIHIPGLATGGLAVGPTLAMIGDNKSGKELVMPMDSPKSVALLAAAMGKAVDSRGASAQQFASDPARPTRVEVVLTAGDSGARALMDMLRKEIRTTAGGDVQAALGQAR